MKFSKGPFNYGLLCFIKVFFIFFIKILADIKIIPIFTLNFKTGTMKITTENVKTLGDLLRGSKKISKLSITGLGEIKTFGSEKKEFCNAILRLLKDGRILQISVLKNEGYFGMTYPNVKDFLNSDILEEIQISVVTVSNEKKVDPSNWTLD